MVLFRFRVLLECLLCSILGSPKYFIYELNIQSHVTQRHQQNKMKKENHC